MRTSNGGTEDRGNMERVGESVGAMAGRAADWGMEMSGALFRSAAEMLGGWWSSDAPRQAATAWTDRAEQSCRSHFQTAATGSVGDRGTSASGGMSASGSAGGVSGSMTAGGTTSGATQATHAAPKSQHAAMQSAGEVETDTGRSATGAGGAHVAGSAQIGDTKVSGSAKLDTSSNRERSSSPDSATDGFERARPGYQLGYVARQNPAYKGRNFNEIEPELRKVWESRARTEGNTGGSGSWPEVRGFVDFAYQQGDR